VPLASWRGVPPTLALSSARLCTWITFGRATCARRHGPLAASPRSVKRTPAGPVVADPYASTKLEKRLSLDSSPTDRCGPWPGRLRAGRVCSLSAVSFLLLASVGRATPSGDRVQAALLTRAPDGIAGPSKLAFWTPAARGVLNPLGSTRIRRYDGEAGAGEDRVGMRFPQPRRPVCNRLKSWCRRFDSGPRHSESYSPS
jgi:hypothetical protein